MAVQVVIPIWLIVVLILAAAAGGVLAYFATHSGTMFLFIIAVIAIFVIVISPILLDILKWVKDKQRN